MTTFHSVPLNGCSYNTASWCLKASRQGELILLHNNYSTQRSVIFPVGDATMLLPPFNCLEACAERGRRHGATSERQEK